MAVFQYLRLLKLEEALPGEATLTWTDGRVNRHKFRDLRIACQCAACRDEHTGVRLLDPDSVAADVRPDAIEPVGSYALRFRWNDGHSSGIYPFQFLHREGEPPAREEGVA